MFKRLPAFAPRDDLLDGLARTMVEDQTVPDDNHLNTSPRLFAGFTFIGQFIDHDITFDNTPLALQQADPDATVNFRTPRYDLDSVYGRGPVNEPAVLRSGRPGQASGDGRMSTASRTCRVTATAGRSSRNRATTRT